MTAPEEVRRQRLEAARETGELFAILGVFADQGVSAESNEIVAEFVREKIRGVVDDPEVAEALCPKDHPLGTKRPCLDTGYFQTFNLPHVRLVDLRRHPLSTVTETGIDLVDESLEFDVIVYATGFDAMTGPLVTVDIAGRGGVALKEKWADGPQTYLGLTTAGFPNFFALPRRRLSARRPRLRRPGLPGPVRPHRRPTPTRPPAPTSRTRTATC